MYSVNLFSQNDHILYVIVYNIYILRANYFRRNSSILQPPQSNQSRYHKRVIVPQSPECVVRCGLYKVWVQVIITLETLPFSGNKGFLCELLYLKAVIGTVLKLPQILSLKKVILPGIKVVLCNELSSRLKHCRSLNEIG